jgi:hypothetical protein
MRKPCSREPSERRLLRYGMVAGAIQGDNSPHPQLFGELPSVVLASTGQAARMSVARDWV